MIVINERMDEDHIIVDKQIMRAQDECSARIQTSERQVEIQLAPLLPYCVCRRLPSACPRARRSAPRVHGRRSLRSSVVVFARNLNLPLSEPAPQPAIRNPQPTPDLQYLRHLRKLSLLRVQLQRTELHLRSPQSPLPNNAVLRLRAPKRLLASLARSNHLLQVDGLAQRLGHGIDRYSGVDAVLAV